MKSQKGNPNTAATILSPAAAELFARYPSPQSRRLPRECKMK
jgi:hypothetical protein